MGVVTPVDVIGCDGDICCVLVVSLVLDVNLNANSILCLTNGGITFKDGSDKRSAMSAGNNGLIKTECGVDEFGDIDTLLPRGLFDRRDGVNGGLPGSDGAQTICSGVIESPLTDKFSLPSIIESNSILKCSAEIADEIDRLRSREFGVLRRTERSKGVVDSRLCAKNNWIITYAKTHN